MKNRELKFRVWDSYQNKMYEWDKIVKMDIDGHLTLSNLLNGFIDKHILMQYTGLKDTTGKEIYEDDIVKDLEKINNDVLNPNKTPQIVTFKNACFLWGEVALFGSHKYLTIIGNIYEHENLLK